MPRPGLGQNNEKLPNMVEPGYFDGGTIGSVLTAQRDVFVSFECFNTSVHKYYICNKKDLVSNIIFRLAIFQVCSSFS